MMQPRDGSIPQPGRYLFCASLWALLLLILIQPVPAQSGPQADELWLRIPEARLSAPGRTPEAPSGAESRYHLREDLLRQVLDRAPLDDPHQRGVTAAPTMAMPLPDGNLAEFRFVEAPIMEPGLAGRYPEIRTFRLQSVSDFRISGRAALTPRGFHAIVLTPKGPFHVVPLPDRGRRVYTSVFERDRPAEPIDCHVDGEAARGISIDPGAQRRTPAPNPDLLPGTRLRSAALKAMGAPGDALSPDFATSGSELRTYRMAVATTSQYYSGRAVDPGIDDDLEVLIAIVVDMLRVNAVFEAEVAVSFVLIQDTDLLFFTNDNAYTSDGNACALKDENQGVVDSVLADADYDVSIVLDARSNTSGGCASGSGVCVSGSKARVSSGIDVTQGPGHEGFGGYRLISHELGHIFGAGHTWSGQQGNCTDDQFAANSAYEPGGGTTLMSYSGTCGPIGADGIQLTTGDPYFHIWSIDQMVAFSTAGNGNNCAVVSATGNQPPVVDAGPDYTIPIDTPFVLSGSANDPDGDTLTYTWEQFDLAADRFPLGTDDGVGPIIRSHIPTADPTRTIPPWSDLLAGTESPGELLPQDSRNLTFRLTARDNRAGGGGVSDDTMAITVAGDPFAVTSPNGGEVWQTGCPATVNWDVGGGDIAPTVNLDLTTDGGETFLMLAAGTANDGSHSGPVACIETTSARVRAAAVGNIFFDVSDADFFVLNTEPSVSVNATGGAVDGNCVFEVTFEGSATDDCGLLAADVEVTVDLLTANAVLGVPSVAKQQIDATTVQFSGSVLVSNLTGSPARVGVSVSATDNCGNQSLEADVAEVIDNIPPSISVSLSPSVIFPPNHKFVDVWATVEVADNCDPNPEVVLLSVLSNEPEDSLGDGKFTPDILGVEELTADFSFQVRAERMGMGIGRIYTALYGASDFAGNLSQDSAEVRVPKSRSEVAP